MPISIPTRSELTVYVKAFFTSRFSGRNLGTEGFLGKTWRALTMVLWALEKAVQDADRDACPADDTSADGLDRWAETLGLDNGADGFGRKVATVATGGVVQATGTNGTNIADGTVAYASDGVTAFESIDGPYVIAGGVASVSMIATTEGTAGNVETGEVLSWASPPAGLDATASVTSDFEGGTDEESDAALLARIEFRLTYPPKGGAAADYRTWCENAEDTSTGEAVAIARAYVYPRRSGTGTVDTVITVAGDGQGRKPGATVVGQVQTYIDSVRPVTVEEANVLAPYMPNGQGMTIRCRMTPARDASDFDWDDTAAAYPTVLSYPTTLQVEINGAVPTALLNAFNASTAATRPRIQIAGTGASAPAKAQSVRVTAINTAPANDILTVDTVLVGTAVNGDTIYAGGPGVSDTQDALIEYVDSLGPSRESGFAWDDDLWDSTCAIARLSQTALDTLDASGDRYWSNTVAAGVTIDAVAADVTPTDTIADGPEILYADLVVVTA